jgi:branched-chain amino acid transport system substrate-binding protein
VQGVKGNDINQFREPGKQVILDPSELKSGKLITPYNAARKA